MQGTICIGRHDQYFQKHLHQVSTSVAFLAELFEYGLDLVLLLFALLKQIDGNFFLLLIQIHLTHDMLGYIDFILGDTTIYLGDMSHHEKRGGKKSRLDGLQSFTVTRPLNARIGKPLVKVMSERGSEYGTQRTAQHHAEGAADNFTPPAQKNSLMNQLRPSSRSQL